MDWFKNITLVALGGGLWEFLKFIFPILSKHIEERKKARTLFESSITPILKAADELYGKLFSLALEDFATFINPQNSNSKNPNLNKLYVYYLFSQFWGQLENVRIQSQYSSLSSFNEGKDLIRFIETIESRDFRILDRSIQRVIGEILIENSGSKFKIMSLSEFLKRIDKPDPDINKWLLHLEQLFKKVSNKDERQKVLVFGVVIAALIDRFDPKYKIVRRREIYLNKLSPKSKKKIQYQLLRHYLPFVEDEAKYFLK